MPNYNGGGTEYLLRRRFELLKRKEDEEMSVYETVREFSEIGADIKTLDILSSNPKGYKEIYFVFYGRENNADDTMENANGADNISVNNAPIIKRSLVYVRKKGTLFYTYGKIELVNGFALGQACRDNGTGGDNIIGCKPLQTETIDNITIATNNLFKADSKLAVYAR